MLGFPTQPRYLLPFIALMIVFTVLMVVPERYSSVLVFNSKLINDGEIWRLLTGHLVHSNFNHLYLNCAGMLLVWALHGEYYPRFKGLPLVLISSIVIGIGLFLTTDYQNYYGFSAVIHFLLVWGALIDVQNKDKTGYLLLIGLILKVGYEQVTGGDPMTAATIGANVATESHLIGVLVALVLFFLMPKSIFDVDNKKAAI